MLFLYHIFIGISYMLKLLRFTFFIILDTIEKCLPLQNFSSVLLINIKFYDISIGNIQLPIYFNNFYVFIRWSILNFSAVTGRHNQLFWKVVNQILLKKTSNESFHYFSLYTTPMSSGSQRFLCPLVFPREAPSLSNANK